MLIDLLRYDAIQFFGVEIPTKTNSEDLYSFSFDSSCDSTDTTISGLAVCEYYDDALRSYSTVGLEESSVRTS